MARTLTSSKAAIRTFALLVAVLLFAPGAAVAKTEIHFWHAMTGQLGEAVNELVKQFNDSQAEYEVKPLRKGTYPETLTAAIAAYRQKSAPHIVQVFEVGTQTMMLSGAILPVFQLMKEQEIKIDWKDFIAPVVGYYSKDGNLYSMPFNSSTPIFYYNKDAFQKAGLDPAKPPQTWKQVEEYSKKLIAAGASKCGFSTGWPSWTMVENMHAWHDQPFATKHNGFDGLDVQLLINREFGAKHIGQLAAWQKDNIYSYGGRAGTADPKFVSGECAMYIQSSALIGGFTKGVKFGWATGQLPHWGPPYAKATSIIGGATLWVMKGKPAAENRGTAQFLKFIADTNQQMWWHVTTGYLAISNTAVKNLEAGYHFKRNPDQFTAFAQLTKGKATSNSQGIRLGNFVQIRDVIEAELENIFAGKKTAKQGLDDATAKSNEILKDFAAQNKQ
ncbi:MAG TPA: sn-glycerol-3-phosphate ABC transporter substrate-binding protein UgpB [Methylomirabilota bacterium]|jgi:sn-glycerol 3-phosphate transport system substrate-binding protein|nr:sn-glycerol-3-phosphate ABC transporter substrate-binding protein UgpB [Methylomirabilota bacterium]